MESYDYHKRRHHGVSLGVVRYILCSLKVAKVRLLTYLAGRRVANGNDQYDSRFYSTWNTSKWAFDLLYCALRPPFPRHLILTAKTSVRSLGGSGGDGTANLQSDLNGADFNAFLKAGWCAGSFPRSTGGISWTETVQISTICLDSAR